MYYTKDVYVIYVHENSAMHVVTHFGCTFSRTPETRYYWITFLIHPLYTLPRLPTTIVTSPTSRIRQPNLGFLSSLCEPPPPHFHGERPYTITKRVVYVKDSTPSKTSHRVVSYMPKAHVASSTFVFWMKLLCRRFYLLYPREYLSSSHKRGLYKRAHSRLK